MHDSDFSKHIDAKNFREKTEVPFLLVGKMIMIKGKIRNSPELDFLLDTGGTQNNHFSVSGKKICAH